MVPKFKLSVKIGDYGSATDHRDHYMVGTPSFRAPEAIEFQNEVRKQMKEEGWDKGFGLRDFHDFLGMKKRNFPWTEETDLKQVPTVPLNTEFNSVL